MPLLGLLIAGVVLFRLPAARPSETPVLLGAAILWAVVELSVPHGVYNPTVPAKAVYPVTPGIAFLQQHGKDALIAPLNRGWSLYAQQPPTGAVLPPNGLTVYGLHDVAGYDSLFPGAAKQQITEASGEDPSPPENGNMVFIKSSQAAVNLGARYIVVPPDAPDLSGSGITVVYAGADMVIYENPNGKAFDPRRQKSYQPLSFRIGVLAALLALALMIGSVFAFPRPKPAPPSG